MYGMPFKNPGDVIDIEIDAAKRTVRFFNESTKELHFAICRQTQLFMLPYLYTQPEMRQASVRTACFQAIGFG